MPANRRFQTSTRRATLRLGAACATLLASTALMAQAPPPLQPLGTPVAPAGNPQTAAKIALGQVLFWEEQLSATRTIACGSCHLPSAGGSDGRTRSGTAGSIEPGPDLQFGTADDRVGAAGVPRHDSAGRYLHSTAFGMAPQVGTRQAISAVNAGFPTRLFWDGRAEGRFVDPDTQQQLIAAGAALENQALGPLVNDVEMSHVGGNLADSRARLANSQPLALAATLPASLQQWIDGRSYAELFAEVFGDSTISSTRIAFAMASYQRSLTANQTPHDLDLAGTPSLTQLERQGRAVFNQAGCNRCHNAALLSDNAFHYIGVRPATADSGRMAVTGLAADRGRMRTPGLRNLSLSAPYMADGRFASLREVVDFYNRGGDFTAPNKAVQITPLQLNAGQIDALVAFLGRPLTDPRAAAESGPFQRPTLYSESAAVPQRVESAGSDPGLRLFALEPPLAGQPGFTVAVDGGSGFASARLLLDVNEPTQVDAPSLQTHDFVLSAQGSGSVELSLPAGGPVAGVPLYVRVFVADPQASGGWRMSRSARFSLLNAQAEPPLFADSFEP